MNNGCNGNCNQGRQCDCVFNGLFTLGFLSAVLAVGVIVGFLVDFLVGELK
jgi:hypothetical protein